MAIDIKKIVLLIGVCFMCHLYVPQPIWAAENHRVNEVSEKLITGRVSDAEGPIIGASVWEKGTTNGVSTDINGQFSLKLQKGGILMVSYVGYQTQEIKITTQSTIDIILKQGTNVMDEVVVVGYGTMRKSDLSGASVSIGESAIKGSIITNLDQSLQGRVSGVTAVSTSGAPGSSTSIRVRGQSTINAGAEPLYVIDGVIIQSEGQSGADFGLSDALGNGAVSTISPLSTINPQDIVSMEILKDASATAIYGAQGSNGVVLITTKQGREGRAKVSYDGMVAVQRQTKRLDMMNLREFAEFYNDMASIGEVATPSKTFSDPSLLGVGTNWQDAIFQTALQHQHQVSLSGGTKAVQYYVSGSYMDQDGTIIGSNFNRYSFRANLDATLRPWLKFGMRATYTTTNDDLKLADSDRGLIRYSLTTSPDIPIYNVDGSYATIVREGYTSPNPIALAMYDDILLKRQKLHGNFFFDVKPHKNLTWHTEFGYDVSANKGDRYKPMVDLGGWVRSSNYSYWSKRNYNYWQLKNYITYSGKIRDTNHYTLMLGQECWESSYDFMSMNNTALPSDAVHNPSLGTGTPSISSGFGSAAQASFFMRATFNHDDRYLATYTYRYDGSSNFGPKNRWAGFHSFAGSWRFSNEKFFEKLKKVISNGKLRIGWGQTGNSRIGAYAWGTSMGRMPTGLGMGYKPMNIPNTSIKWESQEQWNVGLDLGFFNDRMNLTFDWYNKVSNDMLMPLQLPSYMGTSGNISLCLNAPMGNYGSIENTGYEISLNTRPFVGEFEWDSDFQISVNRNKLKGLSGTTNGQIVGYGQYFDVVSVSNVGESLYNFYGFVTDGVYKDLEDLQNSPKPAKYPSNGVFDRTNTVWVGDMKYKDISGPNGVPDGVIDDFDKTNIGSPMPKFTFGWNNTFRYKNFDLSLFINGSYGNKVLNYLSMKLTHMSSSWTNQLTKVNEHAKLVPIDPDKTYTGGHKWYDDVTNVKVENPNVGIPRPTVNDPNDNDRLSDRYVEDGSYLRLKNLTFGYTFPKKMLRKIGLEKLRMYINIQNVFTITGYDGYDPEIGASTASVNVFGLDNGRYPAPTIYSFGLNLTF